MDLWNGFTGCETTAKMLKKGVIGDLSGKVGQVVVRRTRGKEVVSTPPVFMKGSSAKQIAHRERFKEAVEYASEAISTSPTKELYAELAKRKGCFPMNVAVADYFHAPKTRKPLRGNERITRLRAFPSS